MNAGSNISVPAGKEFSVGAGSDLTQTDSSSWNLDVFRVNGGSLANSIQIADMPGSVDGASSFLFTPGYTGMNGVELTTADPFAQAGGLPAWDSEWTLGLDPTPAMADTDFQDYTLFTSSGGFDLTTLFNQVDLVSYSASTDDFCIYEAPSDGQLLKIQSGNSLATYRLNVASDEISLTFLNVFAIPEPNVLMLLALGAPAIRLGRRLIG